MKVDFNNVLSKIGDGALYTCGFLLMTFIVERGLPILLAAGK